MRYKNGWYNAEKTYLHQRYCVDAVSTREIAVERGWSVPRVERALSVLGLQRPAGKHGNSKFIWTEDVFATAVSYYQDHPTYQKVADLLGTNKHIVRRKFSKEGVTIRHRLSNEDKQTAKCLILAGESLVTVSEKVGCAYSTMHSFGVSRGILDKNNGTGPDYGQQLRRIFPDEEIIQNSRKIISPFEIDCYFPKHKIGIEFHGCYYHSEKHKHNRYHYNKYILARHAGVHLLQLFVEPEWVKRKEVCASIISYKLGLVVQRVHARKCTVRWGDDLTNFMSSNHMQGSVNSSITGVLLDKHNEVVCACTFSKISGECYTLTRYANKLGTSVVGGFQKLLSNFVRQYNPKRITTFSDNRFFDGRLYQAAGFICVGDVRPDYRYWHQSDPFELKHKFGFRHKQLKNKLKSYSEDLTEHVNMLNHGYLRVYDAGKKKWVLDLCGTLRTTKVDK